MAEMFQSIMSTNLETLGGVAARFEADGWDGVAVVDSQNLSPEPYIALTVAALATTTLGLGIAVTNPTTRHPALAAAAASSLQRVSGGRVRSLSIGRGDSSNVHLGLAPLSVPRFERYIQHFRTYLAGNVVPLAEAAEWSLGTAPMEMLNLPSVPDGSSIHWLRPDDPTVPLEVAGSGKRVIELAARHADRPMLAVGAAPERVQWGVDLVRQARMRAGRSTDLPIGAYVCMVAHHDPAVARRLVRSSVATTARFSVMHGSINGPVDEAATRVLTDIHAHYDYRNHGVSGSAQTQQLSPEFIDRYGIAGTPSYCVDRLKELERLGIDKFVFHSGGFGMDPEELERSRTVTAHEVLPAMQDRSR